MTSKKRGVAVQNSFEEPVDISESGRLRRLAIAQDELINYVVKITGPYLCSVVALSAFTITIAMIAIGCLYIDDCPAQNHIPVYLIVAGASFITLVIGRYITAASSSLHEYLTVLSVFLLCWFITGSVWIFSAYEPKYDKTSGEFYCNRNLYLFAFWITISQYVMSVIVIIYLCILCQLALPIDE